CIGFHEYGIDITINKWIGENRKKGTARKEHILNFQDLILYLYNKISRFHHFYIILNFRNGLCQVIAYGKCPRRPFRGKLAIIISVLFYTINTVFFSMKVFITEFKSNVL